MTTADIPAAIEYLSHWTRRFVVAPETFTVANRRKIVTTVAEHLLEMTPEEAREFEARALPRIAFANPETFALRVIQSLAEVCR